MIDILISLKLSFFIMLIAAVTVGDVYTIWYKNNMLEEYLAIVALFLLTKTVMRWKILN